MLYIRILKETDHHIAPALSCTHLFAYMLSVSSFSPLRLPHALRLSTFSSPETQATRYNDSGSIDDDVSPLFHTNFIYIYIVHYVQNCMHACMHARTQKNKEFHLFIFNLYMHVHNSISYLSMVASVVVF